MQLLCVVDYRMIRQLQQPVFSWAWYNIASSWVKYQHWLQQRAM
jgi:hypothetical protein